MTIDKKNETLLVDFWLKTKFLKHFETPHPSILDIAVNRKESRISGLND